MGLEKPVPLVPSIRDQLTRIECRQDLERLKLTHADIDAALQLERELVARVLFEGGSWNDIAEATGLTKRAAQRRWTPLPTTGTWKETNAALTHAIGKGGLGGGHPGS